MMKDHGLVGMLYKLDIYKDPPSLYSHCFLYLLSYFMRTRTVTQHFYLIYLLDSRKLGRILNYSLHEPGVGTESGSHRREARVPTSNRTA
jgi:hypothetical protein